MKDVITITFAEPIEKGEKRNSVDCFWEDQELMVDPSITGMSASEAAMCVSYDGIPCTIIDGKQLFVPSSWLEDEKPDYAGALNRLRDIAKKS